MLKLRSKAEGLETRHKKLSGSAGRTPYDRQHSFGGRTGGCIAVTELLEKVLYQAAELFIPVSTAVRYDS